MYMEWAYTLMLPTCLNIMARAKCIDASTFYMCQTYISVLWSPIAFCFMRIAVSGCIRLLYVILVIKCWVDPSLITVHRVLYNLRLRTNHAKVLNFSTSKQDFSVKMYQKPVLRGGFSVEKNENPLNSKLKFRTVQKICEFRRFLGEIPFSAMGGKRGSNRTVNQLVMYTVTLVLALLSCMYADRCWGYAS